MSAEPLPLPSDIALQPTLSLRKGETKVWQCRWCGTLVCIARPKPGACPDCNRTEWCDVTRERGHIAGPFRRPLEPDELVGALLDLPMGGAGSDNLAIALCSYFNDLGAPEGRDPGEEDDEEFGWPTWVADQYDAVVHRMRQRIALRTGSASEEAREGTS